MKAKSELKSLYNKLLTYKFTLFLILDLSTFLESYFVRRFLGNYREYSTCNIQNLKLNLAGVLETFDVIASTVLMKPSSLPLNSSLIKYFF